MLLDGFPYQQSTTELDDLIFTVESTGNYTVIVKCYVTPQVNGSITKDIPGGSTLTGTCYHYFTINTMIFPINASHSVNGIRSDNTYYLGLTRCELAELRDQWATSPPFECGHASTQHRYSIYKTESGGAFPTLIANKPFVAGCPPTTEVALDFFDVVSVLSTGDFFEIRLEIEYQGCLYYRGVRFRYLGDDEDDQLRLGMGRIWVNSIDGTDTGFPAPPYSAPVNAVNRYVIPTQLDTPQDNPYYAIEELGAENQFLIIHNIMQKSLPTSSPFVPYYETIKENIVQIDIQLKGDLAGFIMNHTIYPVDGIYNFWEHNFADFPIPDEDQNDILAPLTDIEDDYFDNAWTRGQIIPDEKAPQNNVYTATVYVHVACESAQIDIVSGSVDFRIVNGNYRPILDDDKVIDSVVNIKSGNFDENLIQVFDLNGRHIKTVQNVANWSNDLAGNVVSGNYIYRQMVDSELKVSKIFIP